MTPSLLRRLDFTDVALYAVTAGAKKEPSFLEKVDQLLAGGVDALQLRSRYLKDRDLLELGTVLKEKCRASNALFIVNNRPDIAKAIDADGVHVGQKDVPVEIARSIIGHQKVVGVSTHSLAQALDAQKKGADYVSCGPIWLTPTKPDYEAVGLALIGFYKAALRIPFVVIGGVNHENISEVVNTGARTVAVVRGLFDEGNPTRCAQDLKKEILKNWPASAGGIQ